MNIYALIIFDLGDVVFRTDLRTSYELLAQYTRINPQDLRQRFEKNWQYEEFERGKLSGQDFYRHFCALLQIDIRYSQFVEIWNAIYREVFPEIEEALKQLHGRFKLIALTNTNPIHCQVWPEKYKETLRYFDTIFISSEIGMRKPDREIFEYVLQTTGEKAEQTLFFDDNAENVNAAIQLGITSVLVEQPQTIIATLRTFDLLAKE